MDKIRSISVLRKLILIDMLVVFILNVELRRQPSEALWMWLAALWLVFFVLIVLLLLVSYGKDGPARSKLEK